MIAVIGAAGTIGRNVSGFLEEWGAEVARRDFRLEGEELQVNVDAHAGSISVEVLDESGQPLAGFSAADAAAKERIDDLRFRPRWKGGVNLASLTGQIVRLRLTLRNASLYSVQVQ